MSNLFTDPFHYPLIYVFKIDDKAHKGLLKIGQTSISTNKSYTDIKPNSKSLNEAAKDRIKRYTNTAGIDINLIYTELAVYNDIKTGKIKSFEDNTIHRVLENSNIKRVKIRNSTAREWFQVDLNTVIKAINVIKENKNTLSDIPADKTYPIHFRPEQEEAIKRAVKVFDKEKYMLWNAKMRFGKTLTALELIKRQKYDKVLIATHRPVVSSGWYEDFSKIFTDGSYLYGTKDNGNDIKLLLKSDKKFLYFASLQDLRGSKTVGGSYIKNDDIFNLNWDLVIIDEAHEGTTTELGEEVIKKITDKSNTKVLSLSGTPFNILHKYNENIYTWDYIMEQKSKKEWDKNYLNGSNPYEDLPELKIYTYDLGNIKNYASYVDYSDKAFHFREFFRVNKSLNVEYFEGKPIQKGSFIHEEDVKSFLDLITKDDDESNYPYSKKEYRDMFRHSLWMVPGVAEAKALSKLLKEHHVFGHGFEIVNVAGDGCEEEGFDDALKKVKTAIDEAEDTGYTITLSCGRLTTGVTVPEWTAVFMLSGSYSTTASSYLQTIFRVQSPCRKNGKVKKECYVFDFAPDRTLKMVAESVAISTQAGKTTLSDRTILGNFLNYCPVISIDGTKMIEYKTDDLLQQLKRAYAERVVINGFDDVKLYNDELLKLTKLDLNKFENLKKIIGSSKNSHKTSNIDINNQGFTDEEYEELEEIERKPIHKRTKDEQNKLNKAKEQKEQRIKAISILRGISIRIPLMVYGADIEYEKDIGIQEFTDMVDDVSWREFMPKDVTQELFKDFIKYYDEDIFIAAARKIRETVKQADNLEPLERINAITKMFRCFRNPDKETVLTPWNVVNRHLSDCLGGYTFMKFESEEEILEKPVFIDHGKVTEDTVCNINANILDINAKTGLYPLYAAYSIYMKKCEDKENLTIEEKQNIWFDVVNKNIFVLCKTKMATLIVKRTLIGYNKKQANKVNVRCQEDIVNTMKNESDKFINRITKQNYWNSKLDNTKINFDAIIGNPPYQINDGGGTGDSAVPVYHLFVEQALRITSKYASLITPSRWMKGGKGLNSFREKMTEEVRFVKIFDYEKSENFFPGVNIDGGINYFLYYKNYTGKVNYKFVSYSGETYHSSRFLKNNFSSTIIRNPKHVGIIEKVGKKMENNFSSIVSSRKPYGIASDFFNTPEKYFPAHDKKINDNYIKIYGVIGNKGGAKRIGAFINKEKITVKNDNINKYKLFFSKAYTTTANIPPEIIIGKKSEICTETFLEIGGFATLQEAKFCLKYISTKFFRALLLFNRHSLNISKSSFELIPLLIFNKEYTDEELYKMYNLNTDEIDFIENNIDKMDC